MRIKRKHHTHERCITKKNEEKLLQAQNGRYIQIKEVVRSYLEGENRLKALE